MKKVLVLMVALAALAVPSLAFAGEEHGNSDTNSDSGTVTTSGGSGAGAATGGVSVSRRGSLDVCGGSRGGGRDVDCSQTARGRLCAANQIGASNALAQNCGNTTINRLNRFGRSGVGVGRLGVGGASGVTSVSNVGLARTGFDAWILALVGGVALAGGLGVLAAQRRGRLTR